MKKLTLTIFATVVLALTSPFANGQNSIWSLPPSYYNHNIDTYDSLPIPDFDWDGITQNDTSSMEDGYDGQAARFTHNAMQDVNGDLLFFIVDDFVFNHNGNMIARLKVPSTYYQGLSNSEIQIIPVHGECDKYIIMLNSYYHTTENMVVHPRFLPIYTVLDLSMYGTEPFAGLMDISGFGSNNEFIALYDLVTDTTINIGGVQRANTFTAVTKERSDGSRLLFQSTGDYLLRYKITGTTIAYDNAWWLLPNSVGDEEVRSEMELIELSNGNYRIAVPYYSNSPSAVSLFVAELDTDGDTLSSNKLSLQKSTTDAHIKGVEFSPNGRYLYFTHLTNSLNTTPVKVYDFNTSNYVTITDATFLSEIDDFKYSFIELSGDGKLYLANDTYLATIDDADTPTSLTWNNTAISITYEENQINYQSGIPDWAKAYVLPDQIDAMNYAAHFTATLECCVAHTTFTTGTDSTNHEQSGTQSWTTSSNPFNNLDTITVKDELIIKSGANITATNLRFEFAPNAKLTIEEGAVFTISGCTLTVNTECDTNAMWIGVDVLGVDTGQQTGSGKLIASSSLIEHSYIGVHNYKTVAGTRNEDYGYRGGIIQASGTTFRNNHRATVYFEYQNVNGSGSPINDLSYFNNCTFITDAQLNQDTLTPTVIMAHLFDVQGVNFYGCDFKNTANTTTIPYIDRGLGISAHNCLLTVTRKCSPDVYCNTPDRGNFTDLLRGIESTSTSTRTTEVSYTNFTNNWRDIYLETVDLATIIENNINVGADSYWGSSYGLYLNECDGYTVENNAFTTNTTTQNGYVGVYVLNSDTNNNEVYRNTFDKFYIGSQAAEVNGNGVFGSGSKGLIFRCNTYTNGRDHDILISSGIVNQTHGTCTNATTPSNNRFSYTTQYGDFWHVDTTKNISYQFSQPNGYNLAPRDYMAGPPDPTHYNGVNTFPTICGSYNFNPSTGCPDRINTGGGSESFSGGENTEGLMEEMEAYQGIVEELEEELTKIDNNDAEALKAQQETIAHYKNEAEKTKNNIIRYYLLNQQLEERFSEIEPLLENETNPHKPMRFYLAARKYNKAQELLNELSSQKAYAAFNKLYSSLLELEQSSNFEEELKTNTSLLQNITELAETSENIYEKAIARTLLKRAGLRNDLETIEILNMSSARLMNQSEEDKIQNSALITHNTITVYPNPTSGEVNITHNLSLEKGKVMFKIYNMLGTEVLNENLTSTNNEVKINNLKSGVYFYTVTQNNQTIKTDKLMVR
jgi:hypothetical protein